VAAAHCSKKAESSGPGDISAVRDWGWALEYVEAMYRMLQQMVPDDYAFALQREPQPEDFCRYKACVGLDWGFALLLMLNVTTNRYW